MPIYFIQRASDNCIKIGKTRNLVTRLSFLKRDYKPDTLTPLGRMDGYTQKEIELHIQFSTLRVEGEWFKPESELLGFISNHTQPFYHLIHKPQTAKCQAPVNGRQCRNWAEIGGTYCGPHRKMINFQSQKGTGLNLRQAGDYLKVSPATVLCLIRRESIKAERFGNYWAIEKESVEEYKKRNEDKSQFDPTRS